MHSNFLVGLSVLACLVTASTAATITFKEAVAGNSCFQQPIPFNVNPQSSFQYSIAVQQIIQLPSGCDASQILLSPMFISGTCLQSRDNSNEGCPSADPTGTTITGSTATSGLSVSTNSTDSLCNTVFSQQSSTALSSTTTSTAYDSGSVSCTPSQTGYFFIQNNCPAASGSSVVLEITVDYSVTSTSTSSCSSTSYYNGYNDYNSNYQTNDTWFIVMGVCVGVFILVFVGLFCLRKKKMNAASAQVQMMPPPPPPGAPQYPYAGGAYAPPPPSGIPMYTANTGQYSNTGGGAPLPPSSTTTGYSPYPSTPGGGGAVPPPSTTTTSYPQPQYGNSSATQQYPPPVQSSSQPAVWYAGGNPK